MQIILKKDLLKSNYMLIGIVFLIVSIPLLRYGFSADDILNRLIRGSVMNAHQTLLNFTKEIVTSWAHNGRIYPLSFYITYVMFYYLDNHLLLYNFIHWTGILIAISISAVFFSRFTPFKSNVLLFFVLIPVGWALPVHSFLVSQALLLPLVISFIMLTLINYLCFLETNQRKYIVISALFYSLALLTYEIALVVPPALLVLNKWKNDFYLKKKAVSTGSIFFITAFYLGAIFFFKNPAFPGYEGTTLGSLQAIPITLFNQLSSEFPIYSFIHRVPLNVAWFDYFLAGILMFCFYKLIFRLLISSKPFQKSFPLLLLSLIFQLVPAFLIAISKRYQHEISFGAGHLPTFLQQIGLSIMITVGLLKFFSSMKSSRQRRARVLIALFLSGIIATLFLSNQTQTNHWNHATRYSREIYEDALRQGFLEELPLHSILLKELVGLDYLSNSSDERAQLANRGDILLFNFNGKAPLVDEKFEKEFTRRFNNPSEQHIFYLHFQHVLTSPKSGYVLLGHVQQFSGLIPHVELKLDKIKLFYKARSRKALHEITQEIHSKYGINSDHVFNQLTLSSFPIQGHITLGSEVLGHYRKIK